VTCGGPISLDRIQGHSGGALSVLPNLCLR